MMTLHKALRQLLSGRKVQVRVHGATANPLADTASITSGDKTESTSSNQGTATAESAAVFNPADFYLSAKHSRVMPMS